MRPTLILLALLCYGCTSGPTPEEKALIAQVESRVLLPNGAGKLVCYERHYALLRGDEVQKHIGPLAIDEILVGFYLPSENPGVRWARTYQELPQIADAGCNMLKVFHRPGEIERITATCSTTMAGVSPDEVKPPLTC